MSRREWACLTFAVVVMMGFFIHLWMYPSSYDAVYYENAGKDIAQNGLFRKFLASELRTYAYPLFLSVLWRISVLTHLPFAVVVFAAQLILYVSAAFWLRQQIALINKTTAEIVFCGVLLNYYALSYVPDVLTESTSLALTMAAISCWLWAQRETKDLAPLLVGSLIVGVATMVRPANIALVAAWAFACGLLLARRYTWRPAVLRMGLIVLGAALPWAPQVANNARHYGRWTPFPTLDVGKLQLIAGIQNLKYATAMPPVADIRSPGASVYYTNPFAAGAPIDESATRLWYLQHPVRGFMTVALHTFNLTDQDLFFTYSRDLHPWYRLPLGVINHAVVALGLLCLLILSRAGLAAGGSQRDATLALLALLGSNWAVHATTAVEMRFGLVLLAVFFPLAGYALLRMRAASPSARRFVTIYVSGYVLSALLLSEWVRSLAPQIAAAAP